MQYTRNPASPSCPVLTPALGNKWIFMKWMTLTDTTRNEHKHNEQMECDFILEKVSLHAAFKNKCEEWQGTLNSTQEQWAE